MSKLHSSISGKTRTEKQIHFQIRYSGQIYKHIHTGLTFCLQNGGGGGRSGCSLYRGKAQIPKIPFKPIKCMHVRQHVQYLPEYSAHFRCTISGSKLQVCTMLQHENVCSSKRSTMHQAVAKMFLPHLTRR